MNEYEVEIIIGKKRNKFQVKWKNYKQRIWKPEENLTNCKKKKDRMIYIIMVLNRNLADQTTELMMKNDKYRVRIIDKWIVQQLQNNNIFLKKIMNEFKNKKKGNVMTMDIYEAISSQSDYEILYSLS